MSFWDTSALVKLYARERDSDRFVELARKSETRATISQFSIHEMRCLLHRKEFARAIPADAAELAYRKFYAHVEDAVLKIIPYGPEVALEFDRVVRICYRASPVVPIRALDGLLLASALIARISELVSTDLRMRAAAVLLGLRIFPG
ncbi:MAG: type II toxin-antitoxin system VapC family toxin [Chthoniobacterales bacterium]|nr:type II toxin-antitoxin system VapC family toxin [Chthoniobacterales bacterium]